MRFYTIVSVLLVGIAAASPTFEANQPAFEESALEARNPQGRTCGRCCNVGGEFRGKSCCPGKNCAVCNPGLSTPSSRLVGGEYLGRYTVTKRTS
ncbi:hypothetical protein SNOG_08355 [Parastagonospora nodorum SN15]|uniref:Uncharacterized protein n=1 Tax=Phaeosphaeria nodorum (strain SN15 / ATCC MYA-4574 / FGSC 10173) TaxID=321614 RepID=Q0UIQ9_PHANO|nr:hypothetical protein SNOG_08355 [Parastagonospora nodorum SN15]EAT84631.1 hypothetical protein SNOG_08355 [Parastagonospora nodorum SN15]